ncbi:MAG TPA: hypothetical protein VMY37_25065 [Thermoguttaceae bacterium]|nr:hypothetical protein [Thermoguttaceae bacterium]
MDRKRHIAIVAGLLALSCVVQLLLIRRATVPALDAVGFVEIARRIDAQGFPETIRHEREQPLFPAWVWLIHEGLQRAAGPSGASWATSVQLAAAIPLVLAVVPVYFLSLRLVGPAPAAAGSLFFCLLPEVSRLGADGLGDGVHLLLFCLAFWAVVVYWTPLSLPRVSGQDSGASGQRAGLGVQGSGLRGQGSGLRVQDAGVRSDVPSAVPCCGPSARRNPRWLLVAGTLAALAVLVRAEALVLPAALVVALLALQLGADRRQPWSRLVTAVGCLALGCGLVFGPYLAATGATSPRTAVARILGRYEPEGRAESPGPTSTVGATGAGVWRLADDEPMSFAPKETTISLRRRGYAAATIELAEESAEAFGYVIGALALLGVWRLRRQLVRPVDRFAQIYGLLFASAVLHFAANEGYVSARHLLTLVVIGVGPAGYGAIALGAWIAGRKPAGAPDEAPSGGERGQVQSAGTARPTCGRCPGLRANGARPLFPSRIAWATVLVAAAVCLVEAVEPLHASRLGHRLAAEWLARDAAAPGLVLDTRGWTGLYSRRVTYRYEDAQAAVSHPQLAYVVLERRELEYASRRSRTIARLLDVAARPVATFPDPQRAGRGQDAVVVYRWEPDRFRRWVAGQSQERPTRKDQHARVRSRVPRERL